MQIRSSLKSARKRSKTCQVIKRKGNTYVIDKKNKRFKVKQG